MNILFTSLMILSGVFWTESLLFPPSASAMGKKIISAIISPHGMTDYIHAKENNLIPTLYSTYFQTSALTFLGNYMHFDDAVSTAFLAASVIHFRHDMPSIKFIPWLNEERTKLAMSLFLVSSLHFVDPLWFVGYMTVIHTPNHYRLSWNYIKKRKNETIALLSFAGALLLALDTPDTLSMGGTSLIQALVIGHIIYEERFIFKDFNKLIEDHLS